MKVELLLAVALATGLALAAERGPHNRDDYVPGTYTNARARAANSLRYAHTPNRLLEKIVKGELAKGGDLVCGPGDLESMTTAWKAFMK